MSIRTGVRDNGFRNHLGMIRGTIAETDDEKKMQTVQATGHFGEKVKDIEHWYPYGFTARVKKPEKGKDEQPETVLLHMGSNRSHQIALPAADRRYRPTKVEEGEVVLHDDQKQKVHLKRDGAHVEVPEAKKVHLKRVDDQGNVKSEVLMESGKMTLKHGNTSITLDGTKIILTGEVHLGGDSGQKIIRHGDVDSGGDSQIATTTKVFSI